MRCLFLLHILKNTRRLKLVQLCSEQPRELRGLMGLECKSTSDSAAKTSWNIPGLLPTFSEVNVSNIKIINTSLAVLASTYNVFASSGNIFLNGAAALYDSADTLHRNVFGQDLDEAACTLQASGLLMPLGLSLQTEMATPF